LARLGFALVRIITQNPRQSEVGDLHPAFSVHQHILGFDVAVNHAFVVRGLQRFSRRQAAAVTQPPRIGPIHRLHDEVIPTAGLAEFMNRCDVRMTQSRQRPGLPNEPLGEADPARVVGGRNLERFYPKVETVCEERGQEFSW
jgi:hypothetical protein